ncbi:(2Fe-2S)-binding protein [Kordiimonas lacus]|uniref:Aerobic-type carbon monoxide dehydrogenase, small subunit, CoxS/CutS family n=1 Tax=Kordiimonas lacus TaxID=637679 RepID=A0A1G7DR05_9PROT|nr:2Fe-2S iron-sulfur cluster-binding protein [Kordiimonas lacus]SDE53923.1 Aerobic-type carbon monoxide dehydrogenase, small subunit, CoxS/CutS family [Kordiimonas lacus]
MADISFILNGTGVTASANLSDLPLVDFLQEDQGLTGTKFCCGIGVCRACTVSVRRAPGAPPEVLLACSTPLSQMAGLEVYTVESVATDGMLHPLQEALLKGFAFQCGYCTPGFLMAAITLWDRLKAAPIPASALDAAIDQAIGDHICRCTGYVRYYEAIKQAILNEGGLVS